MGDAAKEQAEQLKNDANKLFKGVSSCCDRARCSSAVACAAAAS